MTSDSSSHPHGKEARLLAEVVRSSRLSLLVAAAGTDKTALLKGGLMPLLHRQASSHAGQRGERVIYFDAWDGPPLASLHALIHEAACTRGTEQVEAAPYLVDTLGILARRLDLGFIILLDRFEEFVRAPAEGGDIARFGNELVTAINRPDLPANFLISLDDEARPGLASLRSRIPGFDDFCLNLASPAAWRSSATRRGSSRPPGPARETIKTQDVYALTQATLADTALGTSIEPVASNKTAASPKPVSIVGPPASPTPHSPDRKPRRMLGGMLRWLRRRLRP